MVKFNFKETIHTTCNIERLVFTDVYLGTCHVIKKQNMENKYYFLAVKFLDNLKDLIFGRQGDFNL